MKYFTKGNFSTPLFRLLNILRKKKIYLFTAISVISLLHTKAYGQNISLSERNKGLEEIFNKIEIQCDYIFIFNTISLNKAKPVSIKVKNLDILQVLELCLKDQPLTYTIIKKTIIIKERELKVNPLIPQETLIVYGTVTDEKGNPFPSVQVAIKNTDVFTLTDLNGRYKIILSNQNDIISYDILGYYRQEFEIKDDYNINVKMSPDLKILEEIILVGYGETNKRDLTGSVGVVDMKDLTRAPVKSFDEAFAGRIAGVQVTSPDGQPGAAPSIIVRGGNSVTQNNSPLYVIDNFPLEDYNINSIHPEDIESIEVLKDASSTAIYGARGANGVILITTKKGVNGKPIFSFNNYYGLQQNTSEIKLMKPYEFVKYQFELDSARASSLYLQNGNTIEDYRYQEGIDWQQQLFRNAPIISSYLSIRGGKQDSKYAFSGSVFDQDGTVIASGFKRYQGRLVVEQAINKRLKVGFNANLSSLKSYGTIFTGTRNTFLNILINAWQYRPVDGNLQFDKLLNEPQDLSVVSATNYQWNPVLTATNELRDRTHNNLTSTFFGVYNLTPNLKFKITGGLNLSKQRNDEFNNSNTRLGNPSSPLGQRGVNGAITYTDINNLVNENIFTYQKNINNKHFFALLTGFTIQQNMFSYYGSGAFKIPNEDLGIGGIGQGIPYTIESQATENRLASFLTRLNYNYKSRYLFTGTFRADGSSKFTGNNIWGYFPSASFAWNLAQEKFLQNISILSESKIRLSYGLTGNNRISEYTYYAAINQGGNNSYMPGGTLVNGAFASNLSNPNLKWESTAGFDLGLDVGFLNQRFTFTTDIYRKITSDLLLNAQLPTSSGYDEIFQNIGSVENKGIEFSLQSFNIRNDKLKWSTSFNLSFNRNKLLGLAQNQQELLTTVRWNSGNDYAQNPAYKAVVGQPIAMFYGYVWNGVYQFDDFNETSPGSYSLKATVPNNGNPRQGILPGDIKYKDINGDGKVDMLDRTIIGNPNPKFFGGLANNISFKNFQIHLFFQFVYGNDVHNINRYLMEGGTNTFGANQFASYQNRWTPGNPSNEYFRAKGWGPFVYSSRVIEDGSFVRLKTLNIGYKIDNKHLQRLAISNFRIYLAAQNLLTLTKYSGNDPEVSVFDSALTPGLDYSSYPRAKVITAGIDISF